MVKESSSKLEKPEMFSGKKDGITFEKFDELMLSWGRKKLVRGKEKCLRMTEVNTLLDLRPTPIKRLLSSA